MPNANAAERLGIINDTIARAHKRFEPLADTVTLIAVSKTVAAEGIVPFLDAGHRAFGENRIQEAKAKWPGLRERYDGIELHLIGPLQSNKAREAVELFDVIQSVDRDKIAKALRAEMDRAGVERQCFVQVNIGGEEQKAGIAVDEALAFIEHCRNEHRLPIAGLMCIPPEDVPPGPYFAHLAELARAAGLEQLSMGMSGDYEVAIGMGATHVRVGSALFGARPRA